jgi:hypothetical protein
MLGPGNFNCGILWDIRVRGAGLSRNTIRSITRIKVENVLSISKLFGKCFLKYP